MAYIMNGVIKDTVGMIYGCNKRDSDNWGDHNETMSQD